VVVAKMARARRTRRAMVAALEAATKFRRSSCAATACLAAGVGESTKRLLSSVTAISVTVASTALLFFDFLLAPGMVGIVCPALTAVVAELRMASSARIDWAAAMPASTISAHKKHHL
jgi:hypothetical protein